MYYIDKFEYLLLNSCSSESVSSLVQSRWKKRQFSSFFLQKSLLDSSEKSIECKSTFFRRSLIIVFVFFILFVLHFKPISNWSLQFIFIDKLSSMPFPLPSTDQWRRISSNWRHRLLWLVSKKSISLDMRRDLICNFNKSIDEISHCWARRAKYCL